MTFSSKLNENEAQDSSRGSSGLNSLSLSSLFPILGFSRSSFTEYKVRMDVCVSGDLKHNVCPYSSSW